MRKAQRNITGHFLDELVPLFDEERETRACPRRPELVAAMGELRVQAFEEGASRRTVDLIRAAEVMVASHPVQVGSVATL